MTPDEFISRWEKSAGAELANSQSFLKELCDLLDVPQPDVTTATKDENRYVFEKSVLFNNGDGTTSQGRVDLYKAGCFVLESKQGSERKAAELAEALATRTKTAAKHLGTAQRGTGAWDKAMRRARVQAKGYAEAIPDEWPPFLVVVDVGHCFDLYSDFSQTGKNYVPFPDPRSYRIRLQQLRDPKIREQLRMLWLDPFALDPSRQSAEVSREIAERLAKLAKSLEGKHDPETVAGFLMRCLFTMFAEDVDLIRPGGFTELLLSLRFEVHNFVPMVEGLWEAMDAGKFSHFLREKVRHFNGKFFKDKTALPVNQDQLELLIEASQHDWKHVEPAIFGTLLERALDPVERHKLGAHYTPRAYVERLVMPTVIEPLREQWDAVYASATKLDDDGKRKQAVKVLRDFHGELCETRVLDPACGSGNFLYVSMELMKRLEGDVVNALSEFGNDVLPGVTIDPHQFLGIEINPRAAAVAELVLWIGFIQWHVRTRDEVAPPEPILKDYHNIECRDAVLTWEAIEPVLGADGNPVTRWDGRATKPNPVTGLEIPDEDSRVQELRYLRPQKAEWPKANYIVGNPPFIGGWKLRQELGAGYTDGLWSISDRVPPKADYVMHWWTKAAELVAEKRVARFGFITTNSIRMQFNRRVVAAWTVPDSPVSIRFAIPDHPWVDAANGADVRIAMTVAGRDEESRCGELHLLVPERKHSHATRGENFAVEHGVIQSNLTVGPDLDKSQSLQSNSGLSFAGVKLHGSGFILNADEAQSLRKTYGPSETFVKPFLNGRDLTSKPRGAFVIDLFGFSVEELRQKCPEVLERVIDRVKPERDHNRSPSIRDNWWLHGRPRREMREATRSLSRFIATPETSKHRIFVFLASEILPDNKLIVVASDDASILGVLSSRIHGIWALALGGRLGVGNDPVYQNTRCFDRFPFPATDQAVKCRIGDLAEQLDTHRKRQQEQHPSLTMTGMYNVLEKLRSGDSLSAKEHAIHEQGLVSVLKQIHDDLDAAAFDAYGWPHDLTDEEILQRLVDLNHERAEEESRGLIRWLRPEFQNPDGVTQTELIESGEAAKKNPAAAAKRKKQPWPKSLPERMVAIQSALNQHDGPAEPKDIAAYYTRAKRADVEEMLATLVAIGNVRQLEDGRFVNYRAEAAA
jgi:hypothetical protein